MLSSSQMVGHPKHVTKALAVGVDLVCAQAGEAGGHTGDIPASILIPACVDAVKGKTSPLTGKPVCVIGAGAVYDGRGLAANLSWGAEAVWVGTRFVASVESSAPKAHKEAILSAGFGDVVKTIIYSGRPMNVRRTAYIDEWSVVFPPLVIFSACSLEGGVRHENRATEIRELTSKGIIPYDVDMEKRPEKSLEARPFWLGEVSAMINDVLPAKVIVENMVNDAARILQTNAAKVKVQAKL